MIGLYERKSWLPPETVVMMMTPDLPADVRAVIWSLDVEENWSGVGENKRWGGAVKKVPLLDKKAALDSMARYLCMFKGTLNVNINPLKELYERRGQKGCQLKPVT